MGARVRVTTPDGDMDVHAGDGEGVYATLCGLDGDEATRVEPAHTWERITCRQCADTFVAWRAYKPSDFVLRLRVQAKID